MDVSTVGLVHGSTAGVELACKGKATVVAAGNAIQGLPFARTADGPDGYEQLLDELRELPLEAVDPEVRRLAYRMAYALWFRMPIDFPLVRMPDPSKGEVLWSRVEQLAPGADAGLDRCLRVLLDGEAVCPPPGPAALERSQQAEVAHAAAPRLLALASARELVDDPSLLAAWGATFDAGDPVTLVIETPAEAMDALVRAVAEAGLEDDDTADLLAIDPAKQPLPATEFVYSRRPGSAAPCLDDESIRALKKGQPA
jgi:hypothetical protein